MLGNKQLYNLSRRAGLNRQTLIHRAKYKFGLTPPISYKDFAKVVADIAAYGRITDEQQVAVLGLLEEILPKSFTESSSDYNESPKAGKGPIKKARFEILPLKFQQFKSGCYEAIGCGKCVYRIVPGKGYFIVLRDPNMVALANDVKTIEKAMHVAQSDYEAMLKKYLVEIK